MDKFDERAREIAPKIFREQSIEGADDNWQAIIAEKNQRIGELEKELTEAYTRIGKEHQALAEAQQARDNCNECAKALAAAIDDMRGQRDTLRVEVERQKDAAEEAQRRNGALRGLLRDVLPTIHPDDSRYERITAALKETDAGRV